MNGEELYALLQDLPDDFITETVVPYRKHRISLRVIIPAIAACLAVVIAAAVYPNIRMQKPDITADSAIITETAALSTISTANQQTTGSASVTQTAADSKTTAKTTSAAVTTDPPKQETAAEAVTTPTAAQTAMSETQPTAGTQSTGNTAVTRIAAEAVTTPATAQTAMSETQPTAGTQNTGNTAVTRAATEIPVSETADAQSGQEIIEIPDTRASSEDRPESITIPVWSQKPIREEGVPEIMTPPNSTKCSFSVMHQAEALNQQTRELLGSFDFEKNDCLVCHLYTNCAAVTATGAAMQNNTLSVQMNCVDAAKYQPTYEMQILLGIPKSLAVSPAQCRTELTHTSGNPNEAESIQPQPESITLRFSE